MCEALSSILSMAKKKKRKTKLCFCTIAQQVVHFSPLHPKHIVIT